MPTAQPASVADIDTSQLMPLVVGSQLLSEQFLRPLAYDLAADIATMQRSDPDSDHAMPIVCTDVCYLNDAALMARPSIAIGPPELNATTAYLAPRLQTAMLIEGQWRIHLDPEFIELRACLWGEDHADTTAALSVFREKYLADFVQWAAVPIP